LQKSKKQKCCGKLKCRCRI